MSWGFKLQSYRNLRSPIKFSLLLCSRSGASSNAVQGQPWDVTSEYCLRRRPVLRGHISALVWPASADRSVALRPCFLLTHISHPTVQAAKREVAKAHHVRLMSSAASAGQLSSFAFALIRSSQLDSTTKPSSWLLLRLLLPQLHHPPSLGPSPYSPS